MTNPESDIVFGVCDTRNSSIRPVQPEDWSDIDTDVPGAYIGVFNVDGVACDMFLLTWKKSHWAIVLATMLTLLTFLDEEGQSITETADLTRRPPID